MKLQKKVLTAVAISAIVLPVAIPATNVFAADYGAPTSVNTDGTWTDDVYAVNNSYDNSSNGQNITTKLPYNENYVPNAAKIQEYLEGYIDELRSINGLSNINWDKNTALKKFTDTRLAEMNKIGGPDGHKGFDPLFYSQNPGMGLDEGLTASLSGTHSDQEMAYYLFYNWYSEIKPGTPVTAHLENMVQKSTNGSVRVALDQNGDPYALINTSTQEGGLQVSQVKKMPAHTFIYE
jgi:hypothetical protein